MNWGKGFRQKPAGKRDCAGRDTAHAETLCMQRHCGGRSRRGLLEMFVLMNKRS